MISMLVDVVAEYINDVVNGFVDPRKRMFVGYLLSAFVIAFLWMVLFQKKSAQWALRAIFNKKVWMSASAKTDYHIFLINNFFSILISPLLISQLAFATIIFYGLYDLIPSRPLVADGLSNLSVAVIFTFGYFLLDDFARFYVHRLMHKWPILWCFHKVHHSANRITPLTVSRAHPVEVVLFTLRSALTQGFVIGISIFFLGDHIDLVTIIGANIFLFAFNLVGANLRHSHVAIYYWKPVENFLISPAQHQIHHSIAERHWDKNYGVTLAIWDRLFGSHCHSERDSQLVFGLKEKSGHSLRTLYIKPCFECGHVVKNFFLLCFKKWRSCRHHVFKVFNYAKMFS